MTNYYQREEIIKSRNDFLDRLIDNLELPVIRLSCPDLKVSEINQKAVDVVNLFKPDIISAVQVKGNKISDIVTNIDDDYSNKINEVIKDKEIKYINKKTHIINGDEIYWNVIFEPVFELNGEIQEILVLIIDITTEIKSNKIMESELKAQEEFLANISHELKTPLNVIYSTIQLFNMYCKSGSLDQNKRSVVKYINSMMQNCYRLSKLINNIVDLSKIEAGFFDLILSNNNIVEVVEEIVMSVTPYTDIKGLNIIFDTDVEEKNIACDPEKIERVMLNLISNAIKFSNVGNKIFVNIKDKNEFIEISIKDNGIGIKHNQLDMIFNRFKQVDKSLSRNAEGTGIGLSLVKAIVEMHKGRIYVESEFGKGSTFTVELPARKVIQENLLNSGKIRNKTEDLQVELSDL
ncbi:MAG: PAS domain-containing sensor histidine kinase [Clostridium sp.]|nr:PAS domain-containing sensor histidine kinase [Clostridium sp.]